MAAGYLLDLLLGDPENAAAVLGRLHAAGVWAALDDFGTGYSSLSYVHRFPLRTIKIDRSFVAPLDSDAPQRSSAIIGAILALAHSLGLEVIAEGVETPEQRDFLARQGCQRYQGYLYCRPLPIDKLEAFIDAHPGPGAPLTPEPSSAVS